MSQQVEARVLWPQDQTQYTAGGALASGQIVQLADRRPAVVAGMGEAYASGDKVAAYTRGIFSVLSASGTTFSAGAPVYWNDSTNLAIAAGTTGFRIGTAVKAKVSGETVVQVRFDEVIEYRASLDLASVAAATVAEQTFTVAGLLVGDVVIVNPPALSVGVGIAGARVSAANTLALKVVNPTAGALDADAAVFTIQVR